MRVPFNTRCLCASVPRPISTPLNSCNVFVLGIKTQFCNLQLLLQYACSTFERTHYFSPPNTSHERHSSKACRGPITHCSASAWATTTARISTSSVHHYLSPRRRLRTHLATAGIRSAPTPPPPLLVTGPASNATPQSLRAGTSAGVCVASCPCKDLTLTKALPSPKPDPELTL